MMIVVTQRGGYKAAVNTEKIVYVSVFNNYSYIYCTECEPLEVRETPEEIAEMCNLKY